MPGAVVIANLKKVMMKEGDFCFSFGDGINDGKDLALLKEFPYKEVTKKNNALDEDFVLNEEIDDTVNVSKSNVGKEGDTYKRMIFLKVTLLKKSMLLITKNLLLKQEMAEPSVSKP